MHSSWRSRRPRQSGHVGALAILDDSERQGGKLEIDDISHLMSERLRCFRRCDGA